MVYGLLVYYHYSLRVSIIFIKKKKKRSVRMSLKEALDNVDTSKLNEERLEEFNCMKNMMLKIFLLFLANALNLSKNFIL